MLLEIVKIYYTNNFICDLPNANRKDVGKIIHVRIKNYNRNTLFGSKENKESEVAA